MIFSDSGASHPCYQDLPSFVLDHNAYDETKQVLIDASRPERAITKIQAKEMAERMAQSLRAAGLQHSDTVCVVHLNNILYPVVFLAIIMAGGRFSGANPSYTASELKHHFTVSETIFIISGLSVLSVVSEAAVGLVKPHNIIVWDENLSSNPLEGQWSLYHLVGYLPEARRPLSPLVLNGNECDLTGRSCLPCQHSFDGPDGPREIIPVPALTSGTTGLLIESPHHGDSLCTKDTPGTPDPLLPAQTNNLKDALHLQHLLSSDCPSDSKEGLISIPEIATHASRFVCEEDQFETSRPLHSVSVYNLQHDRSASSCRSELLHVNNLGGSDKTVPVSSLTRDTLDLAKMATRSRNSVVMTDRPETRLASHPCSFDNPDKSTKTVAALMSTSGTTGLPKMAARSHHSLVMENLAIQENVKKPYEVKRLIFTPFFHGFTAPLALIDALKSGHTTYIMPRFNLKQCLEYIERYNITEIAAPPPVLLLFMQLPDHERLALRSIHLVWSGGAPLSAETQNTALKLFHPDARIVQVYGMTEAGWITTFKYPELNTSGSIGRLLPSYEAKITDEEGKDITHTHKPGNLRIKGPINMLYYLNNPIATSETLTEDNWLMTGDVAFISPEKKIYITDRSKDIIKVRGWQVSPSELEACLLTHELVVDVGVFGYYNTRSDSEVPVAHVVTCVDIADHETQVSVLRSLVSHCYNKLARYKVNDLEIRFKASVPKNPSGKILRKDMKVVEARDRVCVHWLADIEPEEWVESSIVWEEPEEACAGEEYELGSQAEQYPHAKYGYEEHDVDVDDALVQDIIGLLDVSDVSEG